jgi:hypothetical protein
VSEKGGTPNRRLAIATLLFKNHRLSNVTKAWSPPDQAAAFDTTLQIYRTIQELINNSPTTCIVEPGETDQPGDDRKFISIKCGNKEIEISAEQLSRPSKHGMITEVLRDN